MGQEQGPGCRTRTEREREGEIGIGIMLAAVVVVAAEDITIPMRDMVRIICLNKNPGDRMHESACFNGHKHLRAGKSCSTLLALRSIVDVVVHSGSPTGVLQDRVNDSEPSRR